MSEDFVWTLTLADEKTLWRLNRAIWDKGQRKTYTDNSSESINYPINPYLKDHTCRSGIGAGMPLPPAVSVKIKVAGHNLPHCPHAPALSNYRTASGSAGGGYLSYPAGYAQFCRKRGLEADSDDENACGAAVSYAPSAPSPSIHHPPTPQAKPPPPLSRTRSAWSQLDHCLSGQPPSLSPRPHTSANSHLHTHILVHRNASKLQSPM